MFVPDHSYELLHTITGKGLAAHYHFTRQPCIYNDHMISVQLTLTNNSDQVLNNIHISEVTSTAQKMHCFNNIGMLK